jgi:diguanylate cyclase (GGDEF)-like protein
VSKLDSLESQKAAQRRRAFQVLVVDRQDRRREQLLDYLTELGFGTVQIAAAPQSAASFADAQPPHIAIIAFDGANRDETLREARETAIKLREVSREIQMLFLVEDTEDEAGRELLAKARHLARDLEDMAPIWDILWMPSIERRADSLEALGLAMDRAGRRLYYQFETEHWRAQFESVAPKDQMDPSLVRSRLQDAVQEFAKVRDLDAVILTATAAFSRIIEGRPVVYLRWLSIRNSFVVQHLEGLSDANLKGLGFPIHQTASLRDLSQVQPLKEFVKDVFRFDDFTAVLHGTADDPTGVFILLGQAVPPQGLAEFEAVAFLFDLTWGRLQALRDRHALERIDRGTGLPNKKSLRESLEYECVRARRLRHPLSAAAIEVGEENAAEAMNQLEAKLGTAHEAVMKIAGQTLRRALRGTDIVARVDRHRFIVLMPHTPFAEAVGVIDRMCRLIERLQLPALEQASISRLRARSGVGEYPRLSRDADGLMQAMDDALMAAWSGLGTSGTGIRVLVHEVPPGFVPDFEPVI